MYLPRLRDLREDHDMTQAQIAAILESTKEFTVFMKPGNGIYPCPHLVTLADYYKVSTDYLLGREKS